MIRLVVGLGVILFVCGCAASGRLQSMTDSELYNFKRLSLEEKSAYQQELVRRHPEWSDREKQRVLSSETAVGMTKAQVLASLGKPNEILSRVNGTQAGLTLWIYRDVYLNFKGDVLMEIVPYVQDSGQSL